MILLSCQRWPPAAIAELLGYDPATVRRWIHRYNQHGRIRQVHAFFRARTPAEILATAAPHSSPWLPDGYMQNFRQAA